MKQKMCGAASLAPNNVGVMSPADPFPILLWKKPLPCWQLLLSLHKLNFLMRFFKILRRDTKKVGQVLVL